MEIIQILKGDNLYRHVTSLKLKLKGHISSMERHQDTCLMMEWYELKRKEDPGIDEYKV